ncbi:Methyltransferase-like protein 24 [Orchesella cincta]|uniref:Methyltransferase-like protein 24 n=1 Tax=Orchesella cincta TaxID=48709 RepID=A0A1D2MZT5_ORCCI|nr:Methyltransferase-like protein 24 [Orchesella cincta]
MQPVRSLFSFNLKLSIMNDRDMRRVLVFLASSFACIVLFKAVHHGPTKPNWKVDETCSNFILGSFKQSTSAILDRLQLSEKNWYDSVLLRHEFIESKNSLEEFKPWGDTGFTILWNLFAPTFDCPYMKKRIGSIGDGGKWVCGFELLEETKQTGAPCVVYSFGVNRESSFEAEILEKTNCHVFAYDMTVRKMGQQISETNRKLSFKPVGLGVNNTRNLRTLTTLMEENGHTWINMLKIDIEGAEFATLESLFKIYDVLPFGQLQLEIHSHRLSFPEFYHWWERLESKGLRAFSSEINLNPCVNSKADKPDLMEYSFINVHANNLLVPSGFTPIM